MATRRIQQFRYYGDGSAKNYPEGLSYTDLRTGRIFTNYLPFAQLGIQAAPGTKFYLNKGENPLTIGYTGLYEIEYEEIIKIYSLSFDAGSLEEIDTANKELEDNRTYGIVIDVVYEGAGV